MNRKTLRLESPADLLALVPCVLGFHPEDSLVLVVLAGEGDGSIHARVDLAPDETTMRAGVAGLMTAVRRGEARQVALIAYTDDPVLADDALDLLFDELIDEGVDWVYAIRADGFRWYDLECDDACCPPSGTPYDLTTHPITAQSVLDGQVTFRNRAALADSLIGTDTDDMEAVAEAADEAMRRFRAAAVHPLGMDEPEGARRHLVAEGYWVRDRVRRFLDSQQPLDVEEAGRIAVALVNIQVRDVAWSEMTRENAGLHVELWRDLVRRVPRDLLAAPAALLGFAAWLAGDGALAWCAVERCQEAEPDYNMARLLSQALAAAIAPSTWTPLPVEELPLFAS
ncbi:MAG TPA: DUF4192 domain-containing protein [Nocardioidaceae bacterium]|nr:DUF4192 domain-containing protein [Nocardioidaceae bacterium]